jgi:LysR family transcriptional regulator of abg operon
MKLHHLRDLLAVAERGSIRSAAKSLGVDQPAISRSIRDLEKDIGVPLLERQTRGTVLTPMGELFAKRANAALGELRRGREEIEQLQGAKDGTVFACISSLAHIALLPATLAAFRRQYPLVKLRIVEGVYPLVESRLMDGTVDFCVAPMPPAGIGFGLCAEVLLTNTRIVLARKGHPMAHATSLAELSDAEWITTSITDKAENEFNDLFLKHGLPAPRLALQADSALTWIMALLHSDMLAISPDSGRASR